MQYLPANPHRNNSPFAVSVNMAVPQKPNPLLMRFPECKSVDHNRMRLNVDLCRLLRLRDHSSGDD